MRGKTPERGNKRHEFADVVSALGRKGRVRFGRMGRERRGKEEDLLGHVALFLGRLAVAIVVGEADAGGAVGLADHLDHVCWGA